MGRRLLADEPVFAAAVAELEPVFVEQVGFSLQCRCWPRGTGGGDARIQPVLVGVQLALTALWRLRGGTGCGDRAFDGEVRRWWPGATVAEGRG
jgi:phthiocerol/phenolphthiocerol synthesis type-I polyketide synthase B